MGKHSKTTQKKAAKEKTVKEKVKKTKEKEIKLDSLTKEPGFFARIKAWFIKLSKPKKALVISLLTIITAIILTICIIVGWIIGFVAEVKQNYNHKEITDDEINNIVPIDEKIINVALFGIDSRKMGSFKGLSDSIMILSINTGTGDLKLISVMRDSIVEIPDHNGKSYRPNKINSAYAVGGPELAIKTLNKNFGLDIKEYATVNFYGMAEIIEAVDGIEVEVRQAEINAKNGLNANIREQCMHMGVKAEPYLVKNAGKQLLNGVQAVGWARIRSVSTTMGTANDYGRTDRQRYVMEQLLNKALSLDVAKYPDLIKAILPHMETSISFDEALSLAVNVLGNKVQFEQTRVPQAKYIITDNLYVSYAGSSVYYDTAFATKIIHAIIYDGISQDEFLKNNKIEKNNWFGANLGGSSSGGGSGSGGGSTNNETTTPPEGEGEGTTPPEGEGTTPPEGEGEGTTPPEGEGTTPPEGEGEGTTPPEGGGETTTPPEGEGEATTPPEGGDTPTE